MRFAISQVEHRARSHVLFRTDVRRLRREVPCVSLVESAILARHALGRMAAAGGRASGACRPDEVGTDGDHHGGRRLQFGGRVPLNGQVPAAVAVSTDHAATRVHHRSLAVGHDAPPRAADARRSVLLPKHLPVLHARPFPAHGIVHDRRDRLDDSVEAADGRRGRRLGPSAGGRVCPHEPGRSFPLPPHGVSRHKPRRSSGARPGRPRPG